MLVVTPGSPLVKSASSQQFNPIKIVGIQFRFDPGLGIHQPYHLTFYLPAHDLMGGKLSTVLGVLADWIDRSTL